MQTAFEGPEARSSGNAAAGMLVETIAKVPAAIA